MRYDFLRDAQAEAWASHIRGEAVKRPHRFFVEAICLGWVLGAFAICLCAAMLAL